MTGTFLPCHAAESGSDARVSVSLLGGRKFDTKEVCEVRDVLDGVDVRKAVAIQLGSRITIT